MKDTRIAVAEENALLREGLANLITSQSQFKVVTKAENGQQAIDFILEHSPDLVVIDITLSLISGLDVITQAKKKLPDLKTIILTSVVEDETIRSALKIGVEGYLTKDIAPQDLFQAIRAATRGEQTLSPAISARLIKQYLNPKEDPDSGWSELSDRERSVMKLVAEGYTNKEISSIVDLSTKTVEKYRSNVMQKLSIKSVAELTLIALRHGLINPR